MSWGSHESRDDPWIPQLKRLIVRPQKGHVMRSKRFQKLFGIVAIPALLALPLAGCGPFSTSSSSSSGPWPVTFLGGWGAGEKDDFKAVLDYCDAHYNTKATYEQAPGGSVDTALTTRVQGGHPPDLAALSAPSVIAEYVRGNALQPITWLDKSTFNQQYSKFWRDLGTVDGNLYAIYMKADVKSLVWYSPEKLKAGNYPIPKTYDELVALSQRMIRDGKQPWAFGVGGSPSSPWTLTDFIENIFLNTYGPEEYIKWYEHKIPWTSPQVKHVFDLASQIIADDKMIAGGRERALSQSWDQGAKQMVTDPRAQFYQEATFVGAGLRTNLPDAVPGKDYNAFPFPAVKEFATPPVEVGPNGVVAFKDTPGVRALTKCLTDPKALGEWAKRGGYISPNNAVPISAYPDPIAKLAAQMLADAGKASLVVGDASDLMPGALGSDYLFTALQKWFKNPSTTDTTLSQLESFAQTVYR
jgi:alpha-glucoside transport system substrate-binding protein